MTFFVVLVFVAVFPEVAMILVAGFYGLSRGARAWWRGRRQ